MSAINVNVRVQNNFSQTATSIILWHQFGSNTPQIFTWRDIDAGSSTVYGSVIGDTDAGSDYWTITVTLADGTVWSHSSEKKCTIESSDEGTSQTQLVSNGNWVIPLQSGGCTTSLSITSTGIPIVVQVQNNFSLTATSITLTHQFSDDSPTSYSSTNIVTGGKTTPVTIYGNTDSGGDYWSITITLSDGTTYSSSNKRCTIESSDLGGNFVQLVSTNGWVIPLQSGGCSTSLSS